MSVRVGVSCTHAHTRTYAHTSRAVLALRPPCGRTTAGNLLHAPHGVVRWMTAVIPAECLKVCQG